MSSGSAPFARRFPWRSRWVIVLLLATVGSAAYALGEIALGLDIVLVLAIVAIAVGMSWALAAGSVGGKAALVVVALAGVVILTLRIGRLERQLAAVPSELIELAVQSIRLREILPADSLTAALSELILDLGVLYGRLWLWLGSLATDQWILDPVASALVWSVLIWGAAAWAAWSIRRRRQPIAAMLPILMLLGISYAISRGQPSGFVAPLGGTLLLMAFASHDARVRQWVEHGIDSPEGKTSSLAIIVLPIAVVLTLTAAWAQGFSLNRVVNIVEGIAGRGVRDERALADSLGLTRGNKAESGLEPVLVPGLPNRHLIGSGPELSEQIVMEVTVTNVSVAGPAPGYRWKALTYDLYYGRGWQTSNLLLEDYGPGEPVIEPRAITDQVIRQWVRGVGDLGGRVYAAGSPAVLDQQVQVAWRRSKEDVFTYTTQVPLYQVESILPQVSMAELRSVGSRYPDWVQETYLQLPEEVPSRVLSLGRDLTATAATPFDRALTIETYLRAIPYTLDVPEPPLDRDVVDYFLFDLRKGFCDYYASSMVVLARAAGLPARLVVGYFTGTPTRTEGTIRYLVSEAEAHSWVEVYFPEIGWVEFDPTGGRPAIERSVAAPALSSPESPGLELAQSSNLGNRIDLRVLLGITLLISVIGWLIWVIFLDPFRLRRGVPGEALGILYNRLRRLASALGIDSTPGDTPYEFQTALRDLESPEIRRHARGLIGTHVRTAYGRDPMNRDLINRQIRAWRSLSTRLWLERVKRSIQSSLKVSRFH